MISEETDPNGMSTEGLEELRSTSRTSRPVHFTMKDWGILASLIAAGLTALFFLIRTEVKPVAQDLTHHIETDNKRDLEQDEEIKELKADGQKKLEVLHKLDSKIDRLDMKFEYAIPKHRAKAMPAGLRTPMPTE